LKKAATRGNEDASEKTRWRPELKPRRARQRWAHGGVVDRTLNIPPMRGDGRAIQAQIIGVAQHLEGQGSARFRRELGDAGGDRLAVAWLRPPFSFCSRSTPKMRRLRFNKRGNRNGDARRQSAANHRGDKHNVRSTSERIGTGTPL